MKRLIMIVFVSLFFVSSTLYAGNGDLTVSGSLEMTSITKGFLPPRMTTAQRNAIASPAAGLLIYNITDSAYNFYTGATWITLSSNASTVGGYAPSTGTTANTIPVRDSNGKLLGDITGNAATATTATYAP